MFRWAVGISLGVGAWDFVGIWDLGFWDLRQSAHAAAEEHRGDDERRDDRDRPDQPGVPGDVHVGGRLEPGRVGRRRRLLGLDHALMVAVFRGGLKVNIAPGSTSDSEAAASEAAWAPASTARAGEACWTTAASGSRRGCSPEAWSPEPASARSR